MKFEANETKARHLADLCQQLGKPIDVQSEGVKLKFNYMPMAILHQITAMNSPLIQIDAAGSQLSSVHIYIYTYILGALPLINYMQYIYGALGSVHIYVLSGVS